MGILTHWYVWVIIIALVLLIFVSPRALPGLGKRAGKKARETGEASVEAARNFKQEFDEPADDDAKKAGPTEE